LTFQLTAYSRTQSLQLDLLFGDPGADRFRLRGPEWTLAFGFTP